ncbi:hypothetical protein SAMN04515674_104178 [Pseudarcicella hirudinis]|uniref:Uncharacterized protein n=1 Tax=Pseudarcicella hirudinis TaxID=1079859 RepID=A0A1I5RPR0_9BACT|nr:hypothetical protein [Pseudarcicella hirudinis]SFP60390.1 hypothetical protein SAMN04515674_104178 [Pseudarcicella hirudinis]
MAIDINALYDPFKKFFLDKFNEKNQDPGDTKKDDVVFCFDKLANPVPSDTFLDDPNNPNSFNPAKAREYFSMIVNHLPVLDDCYLEMLLNKIDTTYNISLLNAAIPYVSKDISNQEIINSIIGSFSSAKSQALRTYDKYANTPRVLVNVPDGYTLSLSAPENWCDKRLNDLWTSHSLSISVNTQTGPPVSTTTGRPKIKISDLGLWRKISNHAVFRKDLEKIDMQQVKTQILPHPLIKAEEKTQPEPVRVKIANKSKMVMAASVMATQPAIAAAISARPVEPAVQPAPVLLQMPLILNAIKLNTPKISEKPDLEVKFDATRFSQNINFQLSAVVLKNTQTSSATSDNLSITFEYMIVNIERPWILMPFLTNQNWYIPNMQKGSISSNQSPAQGEYFPALPIAFVAVRNLSIKGNFSQQDVEQSKDSFAFGPFVFQEKTEIVNQTITCRGTQIIGWINQMMPVLPPQSDPAL